MTLKGINQRQRAFGARRRGAGGVDHQQRIIILAVQQHIQRLEIVLAAGVIAQIQRISNLDARR